MVGQTIEYEKNWLTEKQMKLKLYYVFERSSDKKKEEEEGERNYIILDGM